MSEHQHTYRTGPVSDQYRQNWERIFGGRKVMSACGYTSLAEAIEYVQPGVVSRTLYAHRSKITPHTADELRLCIEGLFAAHETMAPRCQQIGESKPSRQ